MGTEYVFMFFAFLAFGFMLAGIYAKNTAIVNISFAMVYVLALMAVGAAYD